MTELFATYLDAFLSFVLLYKYVALLCIAFTAAFAIPLPASTLLVAAGSFASQGYMNLYLILAVAYVGNVAGDLSGFFIARAYGVPALEKIGLGRLLHSKSYKRFASYVQQFPQSVIFMTRFVTEAGPAVNLLSGITGVRVSTFLLYDLTGELLYVLLYVIPGYMLGTAWESNLAFIGKGALVMISLGLFTTSIQVLLYRRHRASLPND
jgi:membrane protein DedA with SNARE-associated domain